MNTKTYLEILILDSNHKRLKSVDIDIVDKNYTSEQNDFRIQNYGGIYLVYGLNIESEYTLSISKEGFNSVLKDVIIFEGKTRMIIILSSRDNEEYIEVGNTTLPIKKQEERAEVYVWIDPKVNSSQKEAFVSEIETKFQVRTILSKSKLFKSKHSKNYIVLDIEGSPDKKNTSKKEFIKDQMNKVYNEVSGTRIGVPSLLITPFGDSPLCLGDRVTIEFYFPLKDEELANLYKKYNLILIDTFNNGTYCIFKFVNFDYTILSTIEAGSLNKTDSTGKTEVQILNKIVQLTQQFNPQLYNRLKEAILFGVEANFYDPDNDDSNDLGYFREKRKFRLVISFAELMDDSDSPEVPNINTLAHTVVSHKWENSIDFKHEINATYYGTIKEKSPMNIVKNMRDNVEISYNGTTYNLSTIEEQLIYGLKDTEIRLEFNYNYQTAGSEGNYFPTEETSYGAPFHPRRRSEELFSKSHDLSVYDVPQHISMMKTMSHELGHALFDIQKVFSSLFWGQFEQEQKGTELDNQMGRGHFRGNPSGIISCVTGVASHVEHIDVINKETESIINGLNNLNSNSSPIVAKTYLHKYVEFGAFENCIDSLEFYDPSLSDGELKDIMQANIDKNNNKTMETELWDFYDKY